MDAKGLVERAVQKLFQRDASFPDGVNERSITHRLAIYIEEELRALGEGSNTSSSTVNTTVALGTAKPRS